MLRTPTPFRLLAALLALAGVIALAGCNPNIRRGANVEVVAPSHYDMTLQSYKDGQFLLHGALLSADDLASHFRYLDGQKKLPKVVLLEPSKDYKIKDGQLRFFASLQLTYGFTGYVMLDGKLTVLNAKAEAEPKKK